MKGLEILLEQEHKYESPSDALNDGWTSKRPGDYSVEKYDLIEVKGIKMYRLKEVEQGSANQGVSSGKPSKDKKSDGKKDEVNTSQTDLTDKIAGLMKSVDFYNGQSETPIRFDEEDALNSVSANLLRLQKNNQLTPDNTDDLFVQYMVRYLVGKKKHPLYFEYDPNFFNIEFMEIMENKFRVGLETLLIESRVIIKEQVGNLRGYIQYRPGSSQFAVVSSELNSNDLEKVKSAYVRKTQKPIEIEQKPQQGQSQNQQTPEQPEKRPEEEMKVNPKVDMIKKKAEKEGVESVIKNLSQEQQKVLQNYTNQDWATDKPANQDENIMDIIDLSKQEESFKVFETFPMYRPKRMTEQNLESYSELLDAQNVDRGMCKSTVKVFYDAATEKKRLSDNAKKQFADYITACNLQFRNFMDLGVTKKKIEALENKMGNNPSYQINYSARTIGGNKF